LGGKLNKFAVMKYVYAIVFFTFLFCFSSCLPDHCKDTVCDNGGVCVQGHCSCLNGYEGTNCTEVWNARFFGNWNATDVVKGDTTVYIASFIDNGRPDQFLIMNLGNTFDSILCRRTSYYDFAAKESQEIDSLTSIASGFGTIDSTAKSISFSYTLRLKDSTVAHQITFMK
jgi:hypothetical protein